MREYDVIMSSVTLDELEVTKNEDNGNNFLGLVEGIKILPVTGGVQNACIYNT